MQTGGMSEDPRALRSRRRLQEALRALLTREELTDIGVAELCREAGVHRTTFYGHYENVGNVAADMYASLLDEASAVTFLDEHSLEDLAERYVDATTSVLHGVRSERRSLRVLLASEVSLGFRRRLISRFEERARDAIAAFRARGLDAPFDDAVAASFVSGGVVGAVLLWADSDGEDDEALSREIVRHMPPWWPRTA